MSKRKQYEHPSMVVVELSGKDGLMDYMSHDPAGVREHSRYNDEFEEE